LHVGNQIKVFKNISHKVYDVAVVVYSVFSKNFGPELMTLS